MSATAYLEGLATRGASDAAAAVHDLLVSTATPETDAEALAYAVASMPRAMRAAVLAGIATALPFRALRLGPYALSLACDGATLGELREAGLGENALLDLMAHANGEARAAFERALQSCEGALRAARIREQADAAIAAANAEADARIAAIERDAAEAREASLRHVIAREALETRDEIAAEFAAAEARSATPSTTLHTKRIAWSHTGDAEHPYHAEVDGRRLLVRINDFPAEALYTLFVDGVAVMDLEDWPPAWGVLPAPPPALVDRLRRGEGGE